MTLIMPQIGGFYASASVSIEYIGQVSAITVDDRIFSSGSKTFTSPSMTLAPDDTLIVQVTSQSSTADWNFIDTMSVDGVSSTKLIGKANPASFSTDSDRNGLAFFSVSGLSVSSSTLSVDVGFLCSDIFRYVLMFYKIKGGTPSLEDAAITSTAASTATVSLTNAVGAVSIAGSIYSEAGSWVTAVDGSDDFSVFVRSSTAYIASSDKDQSYTFQFDSASGIIDLAAIALTFST